MFTVIVTSIMISLSQERGLETKGIKPDLIARLEKALEEEAKEEEKDVEMVEPEEEEDIVTEGDELEKEKTPSAPIAIDDLRYVG